MIFQVAYPLAIKFCFYEDLTYIPYFLRVYCYPFRFSYPQGIVNLCFLFLFLILNSQLS